jgi:SAM-dependent methyltransferase
MDLSQRRRRPELMDSPALGSEAHAQALAGLARVNWWSRSEAILWSSMGRRIRNEPSRVWKVLDIASGAGDVTCALADRAAREKLSVELVGCDVSPTAVEIARRRAAELGNVSFLVHDVLCDPLPESYDIVTSSLFLHHLETDDARLLLRRMGEAAGEMVLVNDLQRTRLGYALAWLGCRILSRSPIVHYDGPVSVEGAFTGEEALGLADQAGLTGTTISYHWPQRFLLTWIRP